jgi:hypothetical protein
VKQPQYFLLILKSPMVGHSGDPSANFFIARY